MRILVSGASGVIGTKLAARCADLGHDLWRLVRRPAIAGKSEISWDPASQSIDFAKMENFEVCVHLSGENIAGRRWNAQFKRRILESRIIPTQVLIEGMRKLKHPPGVFLSASGSNFYGNRGEEILTEKSPAGRGFLADVCRQWEAAALQAPVGRIALLRIGAVLDPTSGALAKMLPFFRRGLGAVVGTGEQFFPWISLDDAIGAILHIIDSPGCTGPINLVAPQQIRQREFARTLAAALHRPLLARSPAWMLRLLFGEIAKESLLSSSRLTPKLLLNSGYPFIDATIGDALERMGDL